MKWVWRRRSLGMQLNRSCGKVAVKGRCGRHSGIAQGKEREEERREVEAMTLSNGVRNKKLASRHFHGKSWSAEACIER